MVKVQRLFTKTNLKVCRIKKIGSFKGEILWDYLVKAKKNEKKNT